MAVIKILGFGGMVPATDDRLLPDTAAALSQNCYLYTGQLVGMVAPKFIRNMTNLNYGKAYRIPKNYYDAEHIEDSTWMEFTSIDTDVIRSPTIGDTFDRYYWVSPMEPPRVNSQARIIAGSPSYLLGVPQANTPGIPSITGGVGAVETRYYVTTWVTAFKEEGQPSLPNFSSGKNDGTWNIGLTPPLAADVTNYNISKVRIYRTQTSGGAGDFFFVTELPASTTTFADNISNSVVSSNEVMASTDWAPPPSDLVGWVTMPNGMIAGWKGSELWFCEPYRPHAWPAVYSNVVEYPIVGLGVINQTLVVCTAGYPIVATGIHPDSISMSKLASFEPCMSRGSILSVPEGVFYASPNGLVLVANGVATLVTEGLVQKDEWNYYNKVATMRATRMGSGYYSFGSERVGFVQPSMVQTEPFVQLDDFAGSYKGVLLDNANQRVAFNVLTSEVITTNVFNDAWSGETLIIRDDKLYRIDLADRESERDTALWRSKIFQAQDRKNFAALRVYFEVPVWAEVLTDPYTKLLLHFNGADASTVFTDECGHTFAAGGNAQIDTAQSVFGSSSGLFDGTGDWITTPDHPDFALGSGDFTIECWFNCTAVSGIDKYLAGQMDANGNVTTRSFNLYRANTTSLLIAGVFIGASSFACTSTTQFTSTLNTGWHHMALVRTGNVLKLFIDGVQEGSSTAITGTVNNSGYALRVGALGEVPGNTWAGWIDEFRLSVGIARYTANFTPPENPYTLDVPLNPERNTDPVQALRSDQYGLVRVYANNQLVMTRELRTSGELMRLPSGFKADYWQIEFETTLKINSVQMATSAKELLKA